MQKEIIKTSAKNSFTKVSKAVKNSSMKQSLDSNNFSHYRMEKQKEQNRQLSTNKSSFNQSKSTVNILQGYFNPEIDVTENNFCNESTSC